MTTAKNGLLFRLQRRLLLAAKAGTPSGTTAELAEIVARAVRTREPGQDPATRTFQALRIFVNAELESSKGLSVALDCCAPAAAWWSISFHRFGGPHRQVLHRASRQGGVRPPRAIRRAGTGAPARARAQPAGRGRAARQPARALGDHARRRAHGRRGTIRPP